MSKPTNQTSPGFPTLVQSQRHAARAHEVNPRAPIPWNRHPGIFLLAALLALGAVGCDLKPSTVTELAGSNSAPAAATPPLLEDYSNDQRNRHGAVRLLVDDKTAGSQSQATMKCDSGVLSVHGNLVPGRGVPAFISVVSPLSADGTAKDLTGYQGVRLRAKVLKGILCVQVATSTITNFDFHTSAPITGNEGGFQEVRVPFGELKRAWSEQTVLPLKSITSVNLVSFGLSKDTFAYEMDEIGFY